MNNISDENLMLLRACLPCVIYYYYSGVYTCLIQVVGITDDDEIIEGFLSRSDSINSWDIPYMRGNTTYLLEEHDQIAIYDVETKSFIPLQNVKIDEVKAATAGAESVIEQLVSTLSKSAGAQPAPVIQEDM